MRSSYWTFQVQNVHWYYATTVAWLGSGVSSIEQPLISQQLWRPLEQRKGKRRENHDTSRRLMKAEQVKKGTCSPIIMEHADATECQNVISAVPSHLDICAWQTLRTRGTFGGRLSDNFVYFLASVMCFHDNNKHGGTGRGGGGVGWASCMLLHTWGMDVL